MDEVGNRLEEISHLFAEEPGIQSLFQRPDRDRETQALVLHQLLDALEIQGLLRRFLLHLLKQGRIPHLGEICHRYRDLSDDRTGRVRVTLSVPSPLEHDALDSLRRVLAQRVGKEVLLVQKEDPSLLGGWLAQIGNDELWDASIKGELAAIKRKLLSHEGYP